jgi:Flp pilus assembly protein TadD
MSKRCIESWLAAAAMLIAGCSSNPGIPADTAAATTAVSIAEIGSDHRRAITLMQAEQWHAAARLLETITKQRPDLSGPWLNLGISRMKTGELAAAETAIRQAVNANTANVEAYIRLGVLYRYQGRYDDARRAWEAALDIAPDNPDIHWNLGILYDLYLPDPMLALQHYEHCLQSSATDDPQLRAWIAELAKQTRTDAMTARARP